MKMKTEITRESPIAVIDSGLGGISVLKVLRRLMPNENFIYFGDSANAPYGEKTRDEVRCLVEHIAERLVSAGVKAIVIACNTATGAAVTPLRKAYPDIPIIGIEPAIKPACLSGEHPTVLVMATPLTLTQEKFLHLTERYEDVAEIIKVPCHGLVELIEAGITAGDEMDACLHSILDPYTEGRKIDAAVLGCTHYPHAIDSIAKVLGEGVSIFDGSLGTAKETRRRLGELGLLNDTAELGRCDIYNSSHDDSFYEKSLHLLNK